MTEHQRDDLTTTPGHFSGYGASLLALYGAEL